MTHQRAFDVVKAYVKHMYDDSFDEALWTGKDKEWYFGPSKITIVDTNGGSDGDGEYMHIVFKVTEENDDQYVRITGLYSSYGDSEWYESDMKIVIPRQVMVTVYE